MKHYPGSVPATPDYPQVRLQFRTGGRQPNMEQHPLLSKTIILASKSPRRIEILKQHGVDAIVRPTSTDETLPEGIGARDAVMYLALKKGMACMEELQRAGEVPENSLILSADTVVYKDEILGKPTDRDDAIRMLQKIQNTSHFVATGCALIDPNRGVKRVFCAVTEVFTTDYSEEDLERYIDTENPYDKAGAYAIQEGFGKFIDHIEGDRDTVIGLPFRYIKEESTKFES